MSPSPSLPSHCHPTKFVKGYFLVDAAGILVGWDRSSENCFSHLTGLQVAQNVLFFVMSIAQTFSPTTKRKGNKEEQNLRGTSPTTKDPLIPSLDLFLRPTI